MASNALSGAGVTFGNTRDQLLHIGEGNLAAGAILRLGDGTATILTLSTTAFTVGGDFTVSGATTLTGNVTLGGTLTVGGWQMKPRTSVCLTAAVVTADNSTASVSCDGLAVAVVAGGIYAVRGTLLVNTTVATTGVKIEFSGPAMTMMRLNAEIIRNTDGTVFQETVLASMPGGVATLIGPTSSLPTANDFYQVEVWGVFEVGGAGGTLTPQIAAEVAAVGSSVAMGVASHLEFTKLN